MRIVRDQETVKVHKFPKFQEVETLLKAFHAKDTQTITKRLGFHNKTGILLYGKEGTGKTTILRHFYTECINNQDGLVFFLPGDDDYGFAQCWKTIKSIRAAQSNPIVIVLEEMDEMVERHYLEAPLKLVMDGPDSINNVIFMGTTNYIEKIPNSLRSRPSRFKYSIEIPPIEDIKVITEIITSLLAESEHVDKIPKLANELVGETVDVIKHRCLDILINIPPHISSPPKIGFKPTTHEQPN
jgi:SpoVK/Ycf46/Vps4 family AAA+-type ATPase